MDAPTVVRRRRKIARQQREQTPEASKLGKVKYSDEESSSATDHRQPSHIPVLTSKSGNNPPEIPERRVEPNPVTRQPSGHLSKILQRRDRKTAPTVMRSTSIPRDEMIDTKPSEIFNLMRKARRSLSQPRHKDESSDSGARSPSPGAPRKKPTSPTNRTVRSARETKEEQISQFEKNIMRFEEERRRFIKEKKRFEYEKRELDLMRVKRAAEFDKNSALPQNLARLTERKQSDTSEDRMKLIKELSGANKLVMSKSSDCVPKRNERPSDYESSTESCTSDEVSDESDIEELVKSLPDTTKKLIKEEIIKEWVEESLSMTLDDDGRPKIIVNGSDDIDEHISNGTIDNVDTDKSPEPVPEPEVVSEEVQVVTNGAEIKDKPTKDKTKDVTANGKKKKMVAEKEIKPSAGTLFSDSRQIWRNLKAKHANEVERFRLDMNKCISAFIILVIYCGIGGMIFRFTEGSFENMYKCGVKRVKRDFVDQLWIASHTMREDDWKSLARTRLRKFEEELQVALEAGVTSYSGQKAWTFMNGVVYCMTIVTTIGYGHISPSTNTGRAITIVYAVFGIPLFLILLADFGKLFTRGIKFLWGFVRRVYYTRSCRKVRKTAQVQEVMRGINMVYDIATFRRPSMIAREEAAAAAMADEDEENPPDPDKPPKLPQRAPIASPITSPTSTPLSQTSTLAPPSGHDSPTTPAPEVFEIDDEFNLPISLALFILVAYIIIGAVIYSTWEEWSFFESFYFVFISMSTIGFGDYVPQHPIYMMTSILYLVFGLALTSMCINVVQVKLSDHFRQASSKIGATIGLKMAEEEAARNSQTHTPVELASIHSQSPRAVEPGHLRFEFSPPQQMYIHPHISSPIHTPPPHVEFAPNFTVNHNYAPQRDDGKKKKKEKIKKSKK